VVDDLPPLAQLYRSLTLLEADAYGPSDQLVTPEDRLAQARAAAQALGDILGALLGLAVDTDADSVRAALTIPPSHGGTPGEPAAARGEAEPPTPDSDAATSVAALHRVLLTAAAETAAAYLPTTAGPVQHGAGTASTASGKGHP
jgi:hypothetical protein